LVAGWKLLAVSHSAGPGKPLAISLISSLSGESRALTAPGPETHGDFDPRFSPDGARVSFIRHFHRSQQELFAISTKGGSTRQLTRIGNRISAHDWRSDNKTVAMASDRGGEFRILRLDIQTAAAEPTGIYGEFPIHLATARKTPALVYSALHQDRNIWRLSLVDKSWKRLLASSGQDASPQYSPDGNRICFRSDRGGDEQLWVSNSDGTGAIQITSGTVRPSVGRWAPDGRAIVFNDPRTAEIFVAAFDGTRWNTRNTGAHGTHPVFSHDGKWIYAGGQSAIVRLPATGGPATPVIASKGEALAMSPDGGSLFFVRESNDTTLWSASLATGTVSKALDGILPGCTSCWSVTANGVYFLAADDQSFDRQIIYFQDFRTSERRLIAPYPEPLWPQGSGPFSLSPDGKSLLCVRVDPSHSDVMLVKPFP
jgi:Tol biopolymer transport system component